MAGEDISSSERHIRELGLDPEFSLEEAEVVLKDLDERLAEDLAKRKALQEQLKKRRKEMARLRSGSVLADHGDDEEEDDLVAMHLNQFNYWGRGLRR